VSAQPLGIPDAPADRPIPLSRPVIGAAERRAVDRVLRSGQLAQGTEVEAFEAEFAAALVDGRHCIAVSSGTSALHLGLLAAGIGPGDEVVLPSFGFAASANAVRLVGAEPVFVDIEPGSFCLDPQAVESAISPRTAAVLPVHLYGHPAAMDALVRVAERHGLLVLEDAAQAHGASWQGRPVGTFGSLAAFSFYPTKNMTTGEGGMVVTPDPTLARTLRLLRNQGMDMRYDNEIVGLNARMTDIAGALGRVQLHRLPALTLARQAHAAAFDLALTTVVTPPVAAGAVHVYHQYTVRSGERERLLSRLAAAGIGAGVYYPVPVHRLRPYARLSVRPLDLPETDRAAAEVLSLPVRPDLTSVEVERIVDVVDG
jgi:perosamine synthetase